MIPITAALQGLAALPKLASQIESLVSQLGALEKKLNEKQVLERMDEKRRRNRDAINRVSPPTTGPLGGTDNPPPV